MSSIDRGEKVEPDRSHDGWHRPFFPITQDCKLSERDMSSELLRIAAAAAEEAIQNVLASSKPSKLNVGDDILRVDSSGSHQEPDETIASPPASQSDTESISPPPLRKVSECGHDESSVGADDTRSSKYQEFSSVEDDASNIHATATATVMAASFSRDKWLFKRIYDLMTENAAIWQVLSSGNVNITRDQGNEKSESMVMFRQPYARVEITSTSESALIQISPTTVSFRMYCLDRVVPEEFRGFIFAQERSEDGYISMYGMSASIYERTASTNRPRLFLLHDFQLHLEKINSSLVKARSRYIEATQWNDFVGSSVIKWVEKFPQSRTTNNFFIRRNIRANDVIALLQSLSPRKPNVVNDVVLYQKVG